MRQTLNSSVSGFSPPSPPKGFWSAADEATGRMQARLKATVLAT